MPVVMSVAGIMTVIKVIFASEVNVCGITAVSAMIIGTVSVVIFVTSMNVWNVVGN